MKFYLIQFEIFLITISFKVNVMVHNNQGDSGDDELVFKYPKRISLKRPVIHLLQTVSEEDPQLGHISFIRLIKTYQRCFGKICLICSKLIRDKNGFHKCINVRNWMHKNFLVKWLIFFFGQACPNCYRYLVHPKKEWPLCKSAWTFDNFQNDFCNGNLSKKIEHFCTSCNHQSTTKNCYDRHKVSNPHFI